MTNFETKLSEVAKETRTLPLSIRLTRKQLDYVQGLAEKTQLSITKVIQIMIEDAMNGGDNA